MILDKEITYDLLTDGERLRLKSGDFNTEHSSIAFNGEITYMLLETLEHKFIRIKDKMK